MANETTNYEWPRPTPGADENDWDDILNDTIGLIDGQMKTNADAAQEALDDAVADLEASIADNYYATPLGYATGLYVFPPSVAGFSTETGTIVTGNYYAVWFPYAGRFDGVGWYGSLSTNAQVVLYGATETGAVDVVGGALATAIYGGSNIVGPTNCFVSFSGGAVNLRRGCWIVLRDGNYLVYGRGRAELSERDFSLGCANANPTTASHVYTSLISTDGLNFSGNSYTASGYGPGVALRTAA